jgi:hypothetical protein
MKGRDSTVIEERFMIAETLASMQAHRSNIPRYRRLMRTKFSALERQFIEQRLA